MSWKHLHSWKLFGEGGWSTATQYHQCKKCGIVRIKKEGHKTQYKKGLLNGFDKDVE